MASRPLSDWASLIEIIGGIAVVVSLVYVAYEVRQNTIAMEASTRQEFAAHDIAFLSTILDPSVLAVAQAKYESGQ